MKYLTFNIFNIYHIVYVCSRVCVRQAGVINIFRARILVQVTIYRRLLFGRDGYLDQSEAYDKS